MQHTREQEVFELNIQRRSRFIMVASALISAFTVFSMVTLHLAGMTEPRRLLGTVVLLAGTTAGFLFARAGRLTTSANVLVWTAFVAVTVVAYATGGFRSAASNVYLTVVAFAGWLLGMRSMVAATVLSLLIMLALFLLGQAGLLPEPAPTRPVVQFATTWIAIVLGGLLFYFVVGEMHRNWRDEMALREDLARANDSLEAKVAERTLELSRAKDAAEQASRAKASFLANMSHEIRTPMHAILGLSESLRRESTDPRARERLNLVAQASDHLLTLINNVLDISKIESGKLELAAVEMRIADVFARVRAMLQREAQQRGLHWVESFEIDTTAPVRGDPTRLAQVLLNFAANAIRFTSAGSVTLRCRAEPADRIRFEIEDTGVGIPAADQARIFEAFEQGAGAVPRDRSGSGLGLTINRHLVHAMGGEMGVRSVPGQGSLFWFTAVLPTVTASVESASPLFEHETADVEQLLARTLAGARLLVVDDNEVNRIVVRAQLDAIGLAADDAEDGAQAVEMAGSGCYDLILIDIHMPEVDGIEATRRIRRLAQYRDTPIIALTADAFDDERQRFLDAGMSDHLAKPLRAQQLYGALARWLPGPAAGAPGRSGRA